MATTTTARATRCGVLACLVLALLLGFLVPAAGAAEGDVGLPGPTYVGSSGAPSGSKPESKLWFHAGSWWGVLWSDSAARFDIHRFDDTTQTWVDTGVAVDTRRNARTDVLPEGSSVLIASHEFGETALDGRPGRLLRFSYADGTWAPDAGYPVAINDQRSETLVITRDGAGTLWATWNSGTTIVVNHTVGGDDRTWATPFALPFPAATVTSDDISTIVTLPGQVGVAWSNQATDEVLFATHADGADPSAWNLELIDAATGVADDHLAARVHHGRVLLVHKAELADRIVLYDRSPSGTWTGRDVPTANATRPTLVVDEAAGMVRVFYTGPTPPSTSGQAGGSIYEQEAPLDTLAFGPAPGAVVMQDADVGDLNNVTGSKQPFTAASGVLVVATQDADDHYWSHRAAPPPAPPSSPVAGFSGSPVSGPAPLSVSFSDESTGVPTSWSWDFGDGSTSSAQHPSHVYEAPGTYTVSLSVANDLGGDDEVQVGYVTVGERPAVETFVPTDDGHVYASSQTKDYSSLSTLRVRANQYESYLRFEVPAGPVQRATLRLFVTDVSPDGGAVYAVEPTFAEGSLTWASAPRPGTLVGSLGSVPAVGWVELDVTAAVASGGPVAFRLVSGSTNSAIYSSSEGADPPQLVVEVPSEPSAPVAGFSGSPVSGTAPLSVSFSDESTGVPTSWSWDFGDGSTSSAQHPSHVYEAPGTYTVSLSVANDLGGDDEVQVGYVTVGERPAVETFVPTDDGHVFATKTTKDYSSLSTLRVRANQYESYLRFEVPAGPVQRATLRLFVTDVSPDGGAVYAVEPTFAEGSLTWASAPRPGTLVGSLGSVPEVGWVELDVTAAVASGGPVAFRLVSGSTNSAIYSSSEGADPPQLVVET